MDIKKTNQNLDPLSVLKNIGYVKSNPERTSEGIRDYCPIHGGDNQRSLAINATAKTFYCHNCGAKGDLVELYALAKNLTSLEAAELLDQAPQHTGFVPSSIDTQAASTSKKGYTHEDVVTCWNEAKKSGQDTYFKYKNLEPIPEIVRYGENPLGFVSTMVRQTDIDGDFRGFMCPDAEKKTKFNYLANETKSTPRFTLLGTLGQQEEFYIGEGIATVQTVWEATERTVPAVAAGTCSNILPVIDAIKKKYPQAKPILLVDLDDSGEKAEKAVRKKFPETRIVTPEFNTVKKGYKDFNDMISKDGQALSDVKNQLSKKHILPAPKAETMETAETEKTLQQPSSDYLITADKLVDDQEQRRAKYRGEEFLGMPQKTLPKLDNHLLGFRKFTLVSAAPNVGKTALTIQLGTDLVKNNEDTCLVYISLEMSREDIFDRMRCYLTPMSYRKLYFGEIKDNGDKGWYKKEELEALEFSKKKIETIGNRILILDENPTSNINTENIIDHVNKLKNVSGCKKAVVIIDYLQVLPIPENDEPKLHSDNACDRYRVKQMKKLRDDLNNDPLIVVSEARKPSGGNKWTSSKADIMGSSRIAYGIDCLLSLNELSDEQLAEGLEKEKPNQIDESTSVKKKLANQGISILNLDIGKGRDGMTKGTILMAYYFQENRFKETTWDAIYEMVAGPLKNMPNTERQSPQNKSARTKKTTTQTQQSIDHAQQATSFQGRFKSE